MGGCRAVRACLPASLSTIQEHCLPRCLCRCPAKLSLPQPCLQAADSGGGGGGGGGGAQGAAQQQRRQQRRRGRQRAAQAAAARGGRQPHGCLPHTLHRRAPPHHPPARLPLCLPSYLLMAACGICSPLTSAIKTFSHFAAAANCCCCRRLGARQRAHPLLPSRFTHRVCPRASRGGLAGGHAEACRRQLW